MGFFSKLIKTGVVVGATVGGVLYCKNRKETRDLEEAVDYTGVKPVEFDQDDETITVQINKNKIKNMADQAADKAIDFQEEASEKITEKIGEEKYEEIKGKVDIAKDKVVDIASKAATTASEQKDKIVQKIGEDKIDEAKQKAKDAFDSAKTTVTEKVFEPIKERFNEEDDFVDDLEVAVQDSNKAEKNDDFLEDELDEI